VRGDPKSPSPDLLRSKPAAKGSPHLSCATEPLRGEIRGARAGGVNGWTVTELAARSNVTERLSSDAMEHLWGTGTTASEDWPERLGTEVVFFAPYGSARRCQYFAGDLVTAQQRRLLRVRLGGPIRRPYGRPYPGPLDQDLALELSSRFDQREPRRGLLAIS
jgi:hypothetical protein